MMTNFESDLYRYIGKDCIKFFVKLRFVLFTPAVSFILFFRKSQTGGLLKYFWMICHRLCMWNTGIQIPIETKIGEGFRIAHFGTIVINPDAVIGKNFTIAQGALIGSDIGKHAGSPVIGDNVFMFANSIVTGGVHIGNDVLIAPGAFCNFDVPDNCIVLGNPGKIIQRDSSPTAKHIVYKV